MFTRILSQIFLSFFYFVYTNSVNLWYYLYKDFIRVTKLLLICEVNLYV